MPELSASRQRPLAQFRSRSTDSAAVTATGTMFCAASAAARLGSRLSYQECFTIAVYSLTPAFILNLGVTLTGQQGLLFDLIYLGIAAVYTFLATQRCLSVGRSCSVILPLFHRGL